LVKPKWREHDESKWVGGKEFQSMMSKKDRAWLPLNNIREEFPEPFVENKVQFRDTGTVMAKMPIQPLFAGSSPSKRRNLSQIRTTVNPSNQHSAIKPSARDSRSGSRNENLDDNPVQKFHHQIEMFDSSIPHDKTWQNRVMQSISLRQKHHLN
jgi:hypothetical protein